MYAYVGTESDNLNSTLEYLLPQTSRFQIENPIDFLTVLAQNGSTVYTWAVPGALRLVNVSQGEAFLAFDQIPCQVFQVAGTYTIEDTPLLST